MKSAPAIVFWWLVCALVSCRPDMANQPRVKPLSQSDFFSDRASARRPPSHTVAQGEAGADAGFSRGLTNGTYLTQLPTKLTPELLQRGREQFDAICAEDNYFRQDERGWHDQ